MAAPVGVCYPPIQGTDTFNRELKFTFAIILQKTSWRFYESECNPGLNTPDWQKVKVFPPYEAGISSFSIVLRFQRRANWQQGDPLNTFYECTNIEEYQNTYNEKETLAQTKAVTLAQKEESEWSNEGSCTTCVNGSQVSKATLTAGKVTCDSNVILKQVIAPGCGPAN